MQRNTRYGYAKKVTRGAIIGAMYVALTYVSSLFGLSGGVIQLRLSEMLCILPIFMPEAIPGLYIGCLLSNILTACLPWDIVLGSFATLIGAYGAYALRHMPHKLMWLATLPNILANAIIVPPVLIYAYGVPDGYFFTLATVTAGEIISSGIFGAMLYYSMRKLKKV